MTDIAGVIGLGIMGGAMSRNLVTAGWRVLGFDPSFERRNEAAAVGVETFATMEEVARLAPVLITSLPGPAALMVTASAMAKAMLPRRIIIETSTLALADKDAAAAIFLLAGHEPLDCPLSGTGSQAAVKDLSIYASGDSATIASLGPLFMGFAREVHDVGAFGNGSRMKFVANLLVAIHNVASAEAILLGVRAGLDAHQIVRLVGPGAGGSRILQLRGPMMAEERYEPPTMRIATWQKDMSVIGAFAEAVGCPTPLFAATASIYDTAMGQGLGALDTAAVYAVLQSMAPADQPSSKD